MEKIEYKRLPYMYQGRKIYEWEQSLEEVHCYIEPPPGVTASAAALALMPAAGTGLRLKSSASAAEAPLIFCGASAATGAMVGSSTPGGSATLTAQ